METKREYDICYAAVDVAIIDTFGLLHEYGTNILLGRKPGQEKFRFIGGFSDVNSKSYEDDAIREVKEETRLRINNPIYVGSTLVDDPRYRESRDKIKTILFAANYKGGKPKAGDDVEEVKWFEVDALKPSDLVKEHRPLLKMLKEKL